MCLFMVFKEIYCCISIFSWLDRILNPGLIMPAAATFGAILPIYTFTFTFSLQFSLQNYHTCMHGHISARFFKFLQGSSLGWFSNAHWGPLDTISFLTKEWIECPFSSSQQEIFLVISHLLLSFPRSTLFQSELHCLHRIDRRYGILWEGIFALADFKFYS